MKTYTYKTIGNIEIKADVYRPDDKEVRPVLVFIHGGALIFGHRSSISERLPALCEEEGFVLVSLDYRLAPEVKVPDIIEDIVDAIAWIRTKGPEEFYADPNRMVVSGGSAGGYLTMMAGICIHPRPVALVSYFGYGDVDGDWYTKPSHFYRTSEPLIDEGEARKGVGIKVMAGAEWGSSEKAARQQYYHYLRQNGLWTLEVTGFDPATEREKLDPYCPVRNITSEYPPIMMLHGTDDTDVPYVESADMAAELERHGVQHELITLEGAGHGLTGGDQEAVERAHVRAADFIRQHLK